MVGSVVYGCRGRCVRCGEEGVVWRVIDCGRVVGVVLIDVGGVVMGVRIISGMCVGLIKFVLESYLDLLAGKIDVGSSNVPKQIRLLFGGELLVEKVRLKSHDDKKIVGPSVFASTHFEKSQRSKDNGFQEQESVKVIVFVAASTTAEYQNSLSTMVNTRSSEGGNGAPNNGLSSIDLNNTLSTI
ncbi:hypothetical protein Tco_0186231 [Tanacetum coccineum]